MLAQTAPPAIHCGMRLAGRSTAKLHNSVIFLPP